MTPTNELRWVRRSYSTPFEGEGVSWYPVLQQKWVQLHIPAGQTEAAEEWRDVPTVKEQT